MLPDNLTIVDTETTGASAPFDRIIEIGILRIEKGEVVKEFSSLLNPGGLISPFIENLTGISNAELENAPTFYEILPDIEPLFEGSVFVAHNARFDYAFIKNEYKRCNKSFQAKQLCTVKLSRALFPRYRHHDLSSLIDRFGLSVEKRHRAFDDAKAVWDFLTVIQGHVDPHEITKKVQTVMKKPSLPPGLSESDIDSLPDTSGVYIFYGDGNVPLYIGKSVNIRDRVQSHFSQDHASVTEMTIAQQVKRIEVIRTAGELGALFKESTLIKSMQPLYNRMLRQKRKLLILRKIPTDVGYSSVEIQEVDTIPHDDFGNVLGVFKSRKQIKTILNGISQKYGLCQKYLLLEKPKKGCFGYHLGWCKGACIGKEKPLQYEMRFISAFSEYKIKQWPFEGPILIKEGNDEHSEGFVIDKWCLLGSVTSDIEDLSFREYEFDYDTYKILLQFLKKTHRSRQVYSLSSLS